MQENIALKAVNMMITASRAHKKMIEANVCSKIGLHRTQHMILMYLSKRERLPSQKELAEHFNITAAAVTGALQKLETDGYIERTIGKDNRYNEITITSLGRDIIEKTHLMFAKIDESLFSGFSEEEFNVFIGFFERIHANLDNLTERDNTKI